MNNQTIETDPFYALNTKEIIAILDGDSKYGKYEFEDGTETSIMMPYLSGSDLCGISSQFGLSVSYSWNGGPSRWVYFQDLIEHCINTQKCSDLLQYLFDKRNFTKQLRDHDIHEIDSAYECIKTTILKEINRLMYFAECELVVIENRFVARKISAQFKADAPQVRVIDREYIKDISNRALQDINDHHFDSAITKSRTLLEEVFCYVIEAKLEVASNGGDILKLYKQVRDLYNMHTDAEGDKRIKKLLSGLANIVAGIAEMRNKESDAHGIGAHRLKVEEHHARLLVNSALTMAEFILSVEEKSIERSSIRS